MIQKNQTNYFPYFRLYILDKLPEINRQELEAMFSIDDLKKLLTILNPDQKIRSQASPFKGVKKRSLAQLPVGWDGEETCAISNRPRENKVQYFNPDFFLRNAAQTCRGTDN
ncbi:hypothetical protein [Okeania sp. SIO1I7]|uniref:hypothetical protein n=1 Tax=Okeania sp. SIO1I7 TaxID=2607772 RepID=UPI0013FAE0CA|nr:hypothetical protein [Okeania sp. SIO1I7]NET27164.1 hypothetical protein [Okeania sp. SIO1I7]